ncbi:MAG: hypothetical protein OHK0023_11470 [Anaerolineae bacterium]
MPIELQWEKHPNLPDAFIVILNHIGKWTWPEFNDANDQILKRVESDKIKIIPIVNVGHNTHLPPNALSQLRQNPLMKHPNTVVIIMVINSLFIRTIADLVTRASRMPYQPVFVSSMQIARELAHKAEPKLQKSTV